MVRRLKTVFLNEIVARCCKHHINELLVAQQSRTAATSTSLESTIANFLVEIVENLGDARSAVKERILTLFPGALSSDERTVTGRVFEQLTLASLFERVQELSCFEFAGDTMTQFAATGHFPAGLSYVRLIPREKQPVALTPLSLLFGERYILKL